MGVLNLIGCVSAMYISGFEEGFSLILSDCLLLCLREELDIILLEGLVLCWYLIPLWDCYREFEIDSLIIDSVFKGVLRPLELPSSHWIKLSYSCTASLTLIGESKLPCFSIKFSCLESPVSTKLLGSFIDDFRLWWSASIVHSLGGAALLLVKT